MWISQNTWNRCRDTIINFIANGSFRFWVLKWETSTSGSGKALCDTMKNLVAVAWMAACEDTIIYPNQDGGRPSSCLKQFSCTQPCSWWWHSWHLWLASNGRPQCTANMCHNFNKVWKSPVIPSVPPTYLPLTSSTLAIMLPSAINPTCMQHNYNMVIRGPIHKKKKNPKLILSFF